MEPLEKAADVKPWKYTKLKPWDFWDRFLIGVAGDIYLDRLTIVRTPWFSILLHRIHRPDRQADLHDHPWAFLAIILWGYYIEDTVKGLRHCRLLNWKPAGGVQGRHSIRYVSRKPVWSLVLCGPKCRSWGFWVEGGKRFVKWKDYEKLYGA